MPSYLVDDGLEQPLLGRDDLPSSSSSKPHADEENLKKSLIPHPGPFNLQAFLHSIWDCWKHVIGALYSCLVGAGMSAPKLSVLQVERLQRLQERAADPFKPDDVEHQALLRQLWDRAFPDIPFTTPKSEQWKEMGWQGEDPATDFRGAGRLGLDCLLYLATQHSSAFSRLLGKLDGQRSDWEYPFAVAGLNISFMLLDVVGLQVGRGAAGQAQQQGQPEVLNATRTAAGRGFTGLCAHEAMAFEELFVAVFECLDREWLAQRASYMQFGQVLKAVKAQVEKALSLQPRSLEELRQKLLGE